MRIMRWTCFILLFVGVFITPFTLSGQNKYTVKVIQPDPIPAPIITSVTVSAENKNMVIWEQKANENIQYFNIYHDAANPEGGWIKVGKTMYPGNNFFIDLSSFPNVRSYQYRISVIDKCGNETFTIHPHKTIKLIMEKLGDSPYSLKWNPYQGFDVAEYKIYRGDDVLNLSLIDSTSSTCTTYTDLLNQSKNSYYQVEAIECTDTPDLKKTSFDIVQTRSNISSNKSILIPAETIDDSQLYIYPNPMKTNAVVVFPYDSGQTYQLSILDLSGHTVYSKPVFSGEIEIERKNMKEGLYVLQVVGNKVFKKKLMVGSNKV